MASLANGTTPELKVTKERKPIIVKLKGKVEMGQLSIDAGVWDAVTGRRIEGVQKVELKLDAGFEERSQVLILTIRKFEFDVEGDAILEENLIHLPLPLGEMPVANNEHETTVTNDPVPSYPDEPLTSPFTDE